MSVDKYYINNKMDKKKKSEIKNKSDKNNKFEIKNKSDKKNKLLFNNHIDLSKYDYKFHFPHADSLDLIFYEPPYNIKRRQKLLLFSELLCQHNEYKNLDYKTRRNILKNIELSCYNKMVSEANRLYIDISLDDYNLGAIYHACCYYIATKIFLEQSDDAHDLVLKIISNKIDTINLANLPLRLLCPSKYEKTYNLIDSKTNKQLSLKTSKLYFCRKCKKNECVEDRRYNRSLDEGVNLTITCLFCGFAWNA